MSQLPHLLQIAAALAALTTFAHGEKIVIKGSDTLGAKMVPQMAEQFKADHPGTTFEIAAEGSSTGIAAIIDGTADLGMSSRDVQPEEISKAKLNGKDLVAHVVGYDGIAVIVNQQNPLDELTPRQVERIFTGEVADWSAVRGNAGPISVYTRNTSSGTYAAFKELAMRKRDYGPLTQKMAGNEQIAAEVARNPNGIGYVGLAYVDTPGLKVLRIEGELPSLETIRGKKYKYARALYLLTDGTPQGLPADFLAFVMSPEGQKIVSAVHFIPME